MCIRDRLVFAIEGLICIAMAAPFALVLTWIGTAIGHYLVTKRPNQSLSSIILLILAIPLTAFTERTIIPEVKPVTTKVQIQSTKETVWKNVIAFPKLNTPTESIFKLGIAYPIESTTKT